MYSNVLLRESLFQILVLAFERIANFVSVVYGHFTLRGSNWFGPEDKWLHQLWCTAQHAQHAQQTRCVFFNLWGSWVMGHGSCWGPNIFFLGAYGIREVEVWWCSGSGEPGDPGGTLGDLGPMHRGWQWLSYLASTPKRATGRCRHRQKWTFWRSDLDRSCEATRVATTCNELTLPCSPFDSVEEDLWALLSGTWQWCLGSKKNNVLVVGRPVMSSVQSTFDRRRISLHGEHGEGDEAPSWRVEHRRPELIASYHSQIFPENSWKSWEINAIDRYHGLHRYPLDSFSHSRCEVLLTCEWPGPCGFCVVNLCGFCVSRFCAVNHLDSCSVLRYMTHMTHMTLHHVHHVANRISWYFMYGVRTSARKDAGFSQNLQSRR